MATDTGQKLLDVLKASLGPELDTTSVNVIRGAAKRLYSFSVTKSAADAAAGDALELPFAILDADGPKIQVKSVKVLPAAALTANDSNFATLSLEYDDGAGGANTVVATRATTTGGTGSWTAQTPVVITITAANAVVAAGKQLIMKIAKSGTGVAVPAMTMFVEAELSN